MHIAACKEFYANLTLYLYKKKEVAKSRVRRMKIKLDNMRLASILGVPGNNGICEYIKEVWEESKYIKPLEIPKKFTNDDMITVARRVKSTEMKLFQRFLHFIVMKIVVPREAVIDEVEIEGEDVNEEAEIQGESGSTEKFYDAEDEVQGSADVIEEVPTVPTPTLA
ncbi:hypothetical protein Dimus_027436 [Dionaea muscipula]